MDFEHYHIYVVEGDEQLKIAKGFGAKRRAAHDARAEWCKTQGGIGSVEKRGDMRGLLVEKGKEPIGEWKKHKFDRLNSEHDSYIPNSRRKSGKELSLVMQSFRVPGEYELGRLLGPYVHTVAATNAGMALIQTVAYQEGDNFILLVPKNKDDAPAVPGCRLLKLSEFYAIKEQTKETA